MTDLLPQDLAAAMDRAEAELREEMSAWLDHRTPETKRPTQDVPEWPDLCAPVVLSPTDLAYLNPTQKEAVLELLSDRASDLGGELDRLGDELEDEDHDPETIQWLREQEAIARMWANGTYAVMSQLI